MQKEIENLEDIKILVDSFYTQVREDDLLGPIFSEKIGDHWGRHLKVMYQFWQTLLLDEKTYSGSPFLKHMDLPVEKHHFERWLKLFGQTVDDFFSGDRAEEAKIRASAMARMFQSKLEYMRANGRKPLM